VFNLVTPLAQQFKVTVVVVLPVMVLVVDASVFRSNVDQVCIASFAVAGLLVIRWCQNLPKLSLSSCPLRVEFSGSIVGT